MAATTIPIKTYIVNIASNQTFNEWKGNIFLYKQNGTMAVDLRFVDNPDQYAQYENVNPAGCSLIYASFGQFLDYLKILKDSKTISAILYTGTSAGAAKMILQGIPGASSAAAGAKKLKLPPAHQIDESMLPK